jgi:hypothetical protein
MANGEVPNGSKHSNSELEKIQRNSLYMTFNAPQVDDYVCDFIFIGFALHGSPIRQQRGGMAASMQVTELHKILYTLTSHLQIFKFTHTNTSQHRGLFLTHPPANTIPDPSYSGTLFHASYGDDCKWVLEQRSVKHVSASQSLVLLYRLGTLDPNLAPIEEQFDRIREVLEKVPLGREAREKELGPKKGNKVLGGYDCVIWTCDAITALEKAGMLDFGGRTVGTLPPFTCLPTFPRFGLHLGLLSHLQWNTMLTRIALDEVIAEARQLAGPADARTMVGVDFGGVRVVN